MPFGGYQKAPLSKYQTRIFSQHRSFPTISNILTSHLLSDKYLFLTKLNMYNFHKRKTTSGAIEFHHKLFRRGLRYTVFYKDSFLLASKENPAKPRFYTGMNFSVNMSPKQPAVSFSLLRSHRVRLKTSVKSN